MVGLVVWESDLAVEVPPQMRPRIKLHKYHQVVNQKSVTLSNLTPLPLQAIHSRYILQKK